LLLRLLPLRLPPLLLLLLLLLLQPHPEEDLVELQFHQALYWAAVTLTTVGYGACRYSALSSHMLPCC
jgi:hypothetical protein